MEGFLKLDDELLKRALGSADILRGPMPSAARKKVRSAASRNGSRITVHVAPAGRTTRLGSGRVVKIGSAPKQVIVRKAHPLKKRGTTIDGLRTSR